MSKGTGKRGRPPGSVNKSKQHHLTLTLIERILKNTKLQLSDQTIQSLQVLAAIANGDLKEIVKTLLETIAVDPSMSNQGIVFDMIREDFGFNDSDEESSENVEVVETNESEVVESGESSGMTEITADAA